MLLKILFSVCLLSCTAAGSEYEFATGVGHQYGGFLGAQFSSKSETSKYYASIGLAGVAFGFQKQFEEQQHHSYGVSIGSMGANADHGFIFINYNYHYQGFSNKGWVIGAGIGAIRHEDSDIFFIPSSNQNIDTEASITLDLGYKF